MINRKKVIELENDIRNLEIEVMHTSDQNEKNALLAEKKKKEKDLKKVKGPKEVDMEEQLKKGKMEKHAIIEYQNFKSRVAIINQLNVATKRFISTVMSREQEFEKSKTKEFVA